MGDLLVVFCVYGSFRFSGVARNFVQLMCPVKKNKTVIMNLINTKIYFIFLIRKKYTLRNKYIKLQKIIIDIINEIAKLNRFLLINAE